MQGPSENGDNKNFRKKVKSLLLPKDATNFSMRFAFVGPEGSRQLILLSQHVCIIYGKYKSLTFIAQR
jgi:hypothetical protein